MRVRTNVLVLHVESRPNRDEAAEQVTLSKTNRPEKGTMLETTKECGEIERG